MEKTGKDGKVKAYVLMSGGLDSTLAAKMLLEQGIEVTGVYVSTGFCISAQQKRNGRFDEAKPDVFKVAEELGIDLEVIDISHEYIGIVTNPKYGWGKNVNPCIDCRIYMLQKTKELMEKNGYDFIATGEVVGQRPKSQRKHTAILIEEKSGLKNFLLRPLSAKFHKKTDAETQGWVDREKLGSMQGRSRKPQLALAKEYGLQNIQAPAGGCCYLTDDNYAVRFKDLLNDRKALLNDPAKPPLIHDDMILLSIGRQIKLRTGLKVIAGRNETENKLLQHYRGSRLFLEPLENPGPSAVLDIVPVEKENSKELHQAFDEEWFFGAKKPVRRDVSLPPDLSFNELYTAAAIMARYGDGKNLSDVKIKVDMAGCEPFEIIVTPFQNEDRLQTRLIMKQNEAYFLQPKKSSTGRFAAAKVQL